MEERLSSLQSELNQKEEQLSNSLKSSIDSSENQLNLNLDYVSSGCGEWRY
jgi:hypothetical protein